MKNTNNTPVGLITGGSKTNTKLVDPETESALPFWCYTSGATYEVGGGIAYLKLELTAVPAIIEGVIASVEWWSFKTRQLVPDHVPLPEHDPVGRRIKFETDGTWATLKPMDEETTEVFRTMLLTSIRWEFKAGQCSISVRCLAQPNHD